MWHQEKYDNNVKCENKRSLGQEHQRHTAACAHTVHTTSYNPVVVCVFSGGCID